MTDFNWNKIRSFNNSQNNAFEELVCQLAREEEVEDKKVFFRVGTPDGGVEAYCILNNSNEYGWQAKFFDSMSDSQWRQLGDSFKTAFEKHPKLVKYFICTPLDRQDPRIEKQKWFMDKWNDKIAEWVKFAKSKGREIEFEYWGSSELIHRLSQEKHAGRRYFWFNETEFSDEWFAEKLDRSIEALGNRYTPELNFELDIAKIFDGLARDDNFKNQFISFYDSFLKKSKAINLLRDGRLKEKKGELSEAIEKIVDEYNRIDFTEVQTTDYDKILSAIDALQKIVSDCEDLFYELNKQDKGKKDESQQPSYSRENKFSYELHRLREFEDSIYSFEKFLQSETVALSNLPVLILRGEAGIGKSHLLADIARKRSERGQHSILLLGQHFVSDENPWTQILRNLLRLNCSEYEFLGALNAKAQSLGSRIVVFIDAINEGRGKYFWQDHIKSFIKSFENYKWLGLVISIKTSYEKLLIPYDLVGEDIAVRTTHHGFAEAEYEASKMFFKNYRIEQPSVPLLHPEFQNPLFLKLFCKGISKAGLTRIPEGYEGITTIIDFYLKSTNKCLCEPKRLDYPDSINLVEKAVNEIVQRKVDGNLRFIPYEEAYTIVEKEFQKYSNKRGFLEELISEGQKLYDLIIDDHQCYINKGIVEALSIQLPELIGKELYEVAPHCKSFYPVIESFIESLIWRKTKTITEKSIEYVNEFVFRYQESHDKFLDVLLLVASNPKHYFNADSLHKHLMKFALPDRDAWWTIYIHDKFDKKTSVRRLIDWAWSDEDKSHISDDSIRLTVKAIAWFLTSSNRFLRDFATKALVALLENRISVLLQLLKEFEGVNDPYVYERLFAVAYGCTVRTDVTETLKNLSEYIFQTIFNKEYVYPHILLRDYAREIIEYSLHLGLDIDIDVEKIRPPYKSEWPEELPTDEEIKRYEYDYTDKDYKNYYGSQNNIISSMITEYGRGVAGYGDFGRYTFEAALRDWRDLKSQALSNFAIKRIFEMGYDVEKHGEFDRHADIYRSSGRTGRKAERIGKKYQWIVFYETLARVADNFTMYDESSFREKIPMQYDGPWEPHVRDIDPTMLIKKTGRKGNAETVGHWWFNVLYDDWDYSHKDWLDKKEKLPDPLNIISVKDDAGTEWLVLEIYPQWSEPEKIGQEKWDVPHKNLWYQVRSYLVSRKEFKTVKNYLRNKNFMGGWMPSTRDMYQMYSREYYWSPAFEFFKKSYYDGEVWRKLNDSESKRRIGKVMVTTESFLWEEKYDCSKEEAIHFFKPCETIFKGLNMKFGKVEGEFLNKNNELICFDPSVNNESPSCLLIRKNDLLVYLEENNLSIFWAVLGGKQVIGGFPRYDRGEIKWLEISGVYYLNNEKEIVGSLNSWQR